MSLPARLKTIREFSYDGNKGSTGGAYRAFVRDPAAIRVDMRGSGDSDGVMADKGFDATLAFAHSVGSEKVGAAMCDAVERHMIAKLAQWLGGEDAKQRAALIVAHLLGFDMLRQIAELRALAPRHAEKIIGRLARTLQSYVDDQ